MVPAIPQLQYAAQLLLEYAGGTMQRTNLNKALFYFDLNWFYETGESYTGATYVAIDHGPVVDDYRTMLISPLLDSGAVIETQVEYGPGLTAMPLTLQRRPPPPSDEHLELVARRVAGFASNRTAVDLSEYSHKNPGWRAAMSRGRGSPINMLLALQQLVADDPWLTEPLTDGDHQRLARLLRADRVPLR